MHIPKFYTSSQLPPGRFQHGAPWSGRYLFVGLLLLTTLFLFPSQLSAQRMWINEFYQGKTTPGFIEVAVQDGADLNQIEVSLYDAQEGMPYGKSYYLNTFEKGESLGGFVLYVKEISEMKERHGGIGLIHEGIGIQLLSYGGAFMAKKGPLAGYQSQDVVIRNEDIYATKLERNAQTGEFSWAKGAQNPGEFEPQFILEPDLSATMVDIPDPSEPVDPGDKIKYTVTITNSGTADATGVSLDRLTPDANTTLVPGSFKSTPIAYDEIVNNVQEDISYTIDLSGFDLDGNNGNDLSFAITSPPLNGTLDPIVQNGQSMAQVEYDPDNDYFGPDQFTFTVTDEDGNSCPATVSIQVQPVNDPPSIICGPNQVVVNTDGAQSVAAWATGISTGPANESFQDPPIITVANDNNAIFSVQPSVDAAGTLTYTPAGGASGFANVTVTISDGVFADDANCSFTITVQNAPDAMNDDFTTQEDTNLTGEDLFANNGNGVDDLGFPAGTITHFGGGSLGGAVTDNTAGSTVALAGGTLQVNANGTFSLTGQPFTQGTFTFEYRLANAAGFDEAIVTIEITPSGTPPTAADDAFALAQCAGNVSGNVFSDNGSGADDLGMPAATVSHFGGGSLGGAVTDNLAGASVAFAGGTLSIASNGVINLTNPSAFGVFTVDYQLTNAAGTSVGTVTITITQKVFIVDNNVAPGGNGSLATPFQTLAQAEAAANAAGDFIYVRTGSGADYTGGITLDAGQILLGEGVALECPAGNTIIPAGTRPVIANAGGNGVTLSTNNTVRGLNIGNTSGGGLVDAGSVGTLTVNNVAIQGTGVGVRIDNGGVLAVVLDQVSSNGATSGIIIDGTTGSFEVSGTGTIDGSGGTIQNTTGDGIIISNATNITLSNMLVTNCGNAVNEHGIEFTDVTGTVDFNNMEVVTSGEKNVEIEMSSGSMTFTADDCIFRDTQSSGTGADGLEFGIRGTATATIDIDACSFLRNATNGIQVIVEGTAQVTQCDITTSTFDSGAGNGIGLDLSTNNSASLTYNVMNNPKIASRNGPAVNSTAFLTSTIRGRVSNNMGVEVQAMGPSSAISINSDNSSDVVIEINGNTVTGAGDSGIFVNSNGTGTQTMHATINGNNVSGLDAFAVAGVEVFAGNNRTTCANVNNNTVVLGSSFAAEFRTRESVGGTVHLQGHAGSSALTWTGNGNSTATFIDESPAASTTAPGAACTTVVHPLP